jgi:squalene-associated FAD-dependent desaturase
VDRQPLPHGSAAAEAARSHASNVPRVAIIGGGLAGLAAAVALAECPVRIELFESRKRLGGRAGSYFDRTAGELIDHCQHVAMGCCTNFLDFCRRTGTAELLERHDVLHFYGPDGRRSDLAPSPWLPPPLHLAGSLLGLRYLPWTDKLAIGRALLQLLRWTPSAAADGPTVLNWLRAHGQSSTAIERFWQVVLVSALGETLDRASLAAARKVFLDGFLAHPEAAALYVPRVSLGELYDRRIAAWLTSRGTAIHLESAVAQVVGDERQLRGIRLADGRPLEFDFVILAVPWRRMGELLPATLQAIIDPGERFRSIESSPISGLHLWFDRPITDLPHAVLVGRLSQWLFAREFRGGSEHYYQVVISAARDLADRSRQAILEAVLAELGAVFPRARDARLIRWQLVTEQEAVFSVRPGLDAVRPSQQTPVPNLLLAGDWTATGWPATMEGAVRSGYLAAEAIWRQTGHPTSIVVPDLPRGWLVRLLAV